MTEQKMTVDLRVAADDPYLQDLMF